MTNITYNQSNSYHIARKISKSCSLISGLVGVNLLLYQRVNNFFCDNMNPSDECYLTTDWNIYNSVGIGVVIYGAGIGYLCFQSLGDYESLPVAPEV